MPVVPSRGVARTKGRKKEEKTQILAFVLVNYRRFFPLQASKTNKHLLLMLNSNWTDNSESSFSLTESGAFCIRVPLSGDWNCQFKCEINIFDVWLKPQKQSGCENSVKK